ncbi:hypothetical protein FQN51_000790 [Onygenales sp. PD_10]|nr:hypothetical protein FQN51_000790 [Onygenales sp. PD_10]
MSFNPRHQRSVSDTGPITFTPTTHRVSKAKKGKRVHACNHPGCDKIYTRAEHMRRHEANHNAGRTVRCSVDGCGKEFKRPDLHARHMQRHGEDGNNRQRSHNHVISSPISAASETPSLMSPISMNPRPASVPTVSHQPSPISIGSLIQTNSHHQFGNGYAMYPDTDRRHNAFLELPHSNSDDSMLYSSPDSVRSPASDYNPFHISTHTPILDQSYPEFFLSSQPNESSLPLTSSISDWNAIEAGTHSSSQMLPIPLEGDILQTVAVPISIPFTRLDGDEWVTVRRELTSAPGVVAGDDGLEIIEPDKLQDCFDCYWKHFHPIFPIVHRPTFFSTKPSPLMWYAMLAIGSQYDTRPHAKEYSLALLEACLNILSKRSPITNRSRVSDIQAVFLLEYLSKYRSRRADVTISPQFRRLYGTLVQDRHLKARNPLAIFNTLSENPPREALREAYNFWVENETRRRVLQAAFLLDVQQSTMFQQPLVLLQPNLRFNGLNGRNAETIDLPFPCQTELWECQGAKEWTRHAKAYESLTLSSATDHIIRQNGNTLALDPFRSNLILSYSMLTNLRSLDLENELEPFIQKMQHEEATYGPEQAIQPDTTTVRSKHAFFSYHALLAAFRTPLKALLTVSGESWLFNRKIVEQAEFEQAKKKLRAWVSDTEELKKAVWHAVRVLEYAVGHPELGDTSVPTDPNLDLGLALFIEGKDCGTQGELLTSFGTSTAGSSTILENPCSQEPVDGLAYFAGSSQTLPQPTRAEPVTSLHANWALYICTLICWAYGIDTTLADDPQLPLSSSPRTYISNMISLAPSWSQISRSSIPPHIRRDTNGLLEYIRFRWLQPDRMGGLLNEGERVLQRLGESSNPNDGKLWQF